MQGVKKEEEAKSEMNMENKFVTLDGNKVKCKRPSGSWFLCVSTLSRINTIMWAISGIGANRKGCNRKPQLKSETTRLI